MVIGVVRIVLAGIILCREIVRRQIQEQPCAALIAVKTADDPFYQALPHQLFDHNPCPDTQAAAPCIPALFFGSFASGE